MRSTSRAFTLIELLCVIAIVGVLASIIVGSLSKIRDTARRSECASNLRQIGAAFQLYAIDNKGLYPALRQATYPYPGPPPPGGGSYSDKNRPPGINPSGQNWQIEISRYIIRDQTSIQDVQNTYGQANIAHCPSYDLFFNTSAALGSQNSQVSTAGYGMNQNLNVNGANYSGNTWGYENTIRFRAAALANPPTTILVGDSAEFFINVNNSTADTWSPYSTTKYPDGYSNGAPTRHGATANYLYADGHVETLNFDAARVAVLFKL